MRWRWITQGYGGNDVGICSVFVVEMYYTGTGWEWCWYTQGQERVETDFRGQGGNGVEVHWVRRG